MVSGNDSIIPVCVVLQLRPNQGFLQPLYWIAVSGDCCPYCIESWITLFCCFSTIHTLSPFLPGSLYISVKRIKVSIKISRENILLALLYQ